MTLRSKSVAVLMLMGLAGCGGGTTSGQMSDAHSDVFYDADVGPDGPSCTVTEADGAMATFPPGIPYRVGCHCCLCVRSGPNGYVTSCNGQCSTCPDTGGDH